MAFQLSPGVLVVEKDLTNIIPSVPSSIGAFVGNFSWGPALEPITLASELDLVRIFGRPNDLNFRSFFSAANFLAYSGNLLVTRVVGNLARNAVASGTAVKIENENVWLAEYENGEAGVGEFAAKYPGALGNSLKVSLADAGAFSKTLTGTVAAATNSATLTGTLTEFLTELVPGSIIKTTDGTVIGQILSVTDDTTATLTANAAVAVTPAASVVAEWEYAFLFDAAPATSDFAANVGGSNDEVHIVVIDEDGLITGTPNTVLETFAGLSKATDAKTTQGANNYYKQALLGSLYIYWMDHVTTNLSTGGTAWGTGAQNTTFKTMGAPLTVSLQGGVTEATVTSAEIRAGYDLYSDAETIDVNLIIMGHHSLEDAKYVIENIAERRKDCVVFCSPSLDAVLNNPNQETADIIAERTDPAFNVNSSYAVMDTGWRLQYDKYNDINRWTPLNPDVAGLCARTDLTNDAWWSPAGTTRGQIRNVIRLAFKPNAAQRDLLYKRGINPVVSFPGEGTILYGDKTLLAKPSAFDRINVRRLFILLEKAIAIAAKNMLFEFNDAFTRAQFRNLVEPFLRDVQGRRGITDFFVLCDETNNTGEVVDRNEFVASIFLKPVRSVNFLTLNFIAVRTGVNFEEVVGA